MGEGGGGVETVTELGLVWGGTIWVLGGEEDGKRGEFAGGLGLGRDLGKVGRGRWRGIGVRWWIWEV